MIDLKNAVQEKGFIVAHIKTDSIKIPNATKDIIDFVMQFGENFLQKYDIFKIDKTLQQCMVMQRPIRRSDSCWEVNVRIIDNDYSSVLDFSGCQINDTIRFQSNAMPEGHEEGYTKYQSNVEKHRGLIYSSLAA